MEGVYLIKVQTKPRVFGFSFVLIICLRKDIET